MLETGLIWDLSGFYVGCEVHLFLDVTDLYEQYRQNIFLKQHMVNKTLGCIFLNIFQRNSTRINVID